MENKFKIGDEGFFISGDKIFKDVITGFRIDIFKDIKITTVLLGEWESKHKFSKDENNCFTKQELLKMIEEL